MVECMKKEAISTMLICALIFMGFAAAYSAENIHKGRQIFFPKTSLAECFTATWCGGCPGAEGALNTLANEKSLNDLAIIEHHLSDSYESSDSLCNDRYNFYSVPAIPITFFSGENAALSGSTDPDDPDMYNWYKTKIENDLLNTTCMVLSMDTDIVGGNVVVKVNVTCAETPADGNLYLHVVLVDDHNESVYVSGREYRLRYTAVQRIAEDPITLTAGTVLSKEYTVPINSSWNMSKMHVVAFVQTHNTHTVTDGYYTWKEGKVYNSVIQPIEKWELKPYETEIDASVGNIYELTTVVRNELSETRVIKVGYDPSTLPAGWQIQICVGGLCYNVTEINVTLQPGESKIVYYHVIPSDARTAYIKIYAYGNQWYSDVHYIKVNAVVPEFPHIPAMIVILAIPALLKKFE